MTGTIPTGVRPHSVASRARRRAALHARVGRAWTSWRSFRRCARVARARYPSRTDARFPRRSLVRFALGSPSSTFLRPTLRSPSPSRHACQEGTSGADEEDGPREVRLGEGASRANPGGTSPSSLLPGRHPLPRCRPDHPRLPHRTQDDDAPGTSRAGGLPGANPTAGITKDPWAPPDGWMDAPSKDPWCATCSSRPRFSERSLVRAAPSDATALPRPAAARVTAGGRPVELVVDLTNRNDTTTPAVRVLPALVCGVGKDVLPIPPPRTQFVYVVGVRRTRPSRSNGGILVHCTHGYNRTGAMLCTYAAHAIVAETERTRGRSLRYRGRQGGIYKPEYIRELFDEYLSGDFARRSTRRFRISERGEAKTDAPVGRRERPRMICLGVQSRRRHPRRESRAEAWGARGFAGFGDGSNCARRPREGTRTVRPCTTTTCWEEVFEGQAREICTACCGCARGEPVPARSPSVWRAITCPTLATGARRDVESGRDALHALLMRDGVYLIDRVCRAPRHHAVSRAFRRTASPRTTPRCSTGRLWWTTWGGKQRRRFWCTT